MARSFPIVSVTQSGGPGVPGYIEIAGDAGLLSSFQGKFFREDLPPNGSLPAYTDPAPVGYTLIRATTFNIEENESYAGRYTVYTPVDLADSGANPPSKVVGPNVQIRVNEIVGAPVNIGDDIGTGIITNISTYLIARVDDAGLDDPILIPPAVFPSELPIEIVGRFGSPWGEGYTQNFVDLASNFARFGSLETPPNNEPPSPLLGQLWYDHSSGDLKLWPLGGGTWTTIYSSTPGIDSTARVPFTTAPSGPDHVATITHNIGLVSPFIALVQFFVEVSPGVWKAISPSDISFDTANQLTVTFSSPRNGIVLIRA